MSSSQVKCRGRVQAQGDDIDVDQKGGYSRSWAQNSPVTVQEGLSFLAEVKGQCNKSQQAQRKQAFKKAEDFIRDASKLGGVGPEHLTRSFKDRKRTIKNARVDLEVHSGLAFV